MSLLTLPSFISNCSQPLLVGFSGGLDSTVLLDLCANHMGLRIIAAHFNHGARGKASDEDENFCREFCRSRGIEFFSRKVDIPSLALKRKKGFEETARECRYGFFRELAAENNCGCLLLAHHADDQDETVFMRLQRKAGWRGLAGIRMVSSVPDETGQSLEVVRPLLACRRKELEVYAGQNGLDWREDASNNDTAYRRNYVRKRLLPVLNSAFAGLEESLDKLRNSALEVDRVVAKVSSHLEVNREWGGVMLRPPGEVSPDAFIRRVEDLYEQLSAGNRLRAEGRQEIESIYNATAGACDFPGNYRLRREADGFFLYNSADKEGFDSIEIPLAPFELETDHFSFSITREVVGSVIPERNNPFVEFIDSASVQFPLVLRVPRRGDRIAPLGMKGSRLVSDVLGESTLPARVRCKLPVLQDRNGIIWLPPLRLGSQAALRKGFAGECFKLVFCPKYPLTDPPL